MATPVIEASTTARANPGAATWTVAFTFPTTSNYLRVCVDEGNTARTISGVTYNGVAMTLLNQVTNGSYNARAYELTSSLPTDGASHNIVVTFSGDPAVNCNLTACAIKDVETATARVSAGLDIAALDPVTTATITPTDDASLLVQDVLLLDSRTISSWDSGQSLVAGAAGRYISSLTGPTPATAQAMNFNLSASSAKGASLVVAVAGASSLSLAPSGSEVSVQSGTPTLLQVFDSLIGLRIRWP